MDIYSNTNQGLRRMSNQDNFKNNKISENTLWSVVCDGMGGVNGGNIASLIAVQTAEKILNQKFKKKLSENQMHDLCVEIVENANKQIYQKSLRQLDLRGMGTTMIVILIDEQKAYITHVGDSRVYLKRNDEVRQVTMDHSYVQDLLNRGEITEEEAKHHPHRNIITRSVGVYKAVECDITILELEKGDIIVSCTDGLSNYLSNETLNEMLKDYDEKIADKLVDFALECGGIDNVTATVINV
ncbi:MAG: Stp1/IreP family PP2C-type Ser/Thr phosphatase [Clostridia bacterium]